MRCFGSGWLMPDVYPHVENAKSEKTKDVLVVNVFVWVPLRCILVFLACCCCVVPLQQCQVKATYKVFAW